MKRILCLMLSYIMMFPLTACGNSYNEQLSTTVIPSVMPEENSQISSGKIQDTSKQSQGLVDEQLQAELDVIVKETASKNQIAQLLLLKQLKANISETVEPTAPSAVESEKLVTSEPPKTEPSMVNDDIVNIQITTGDKTFSAKLYNNQTTQAFIKQMPLTITMDELNGNEKFYYLSDSLPTDLYKPTEIKAGDLMLYGSDCLVLFYDSFSTSYSYTRLGFIEDVSGLSSVLGNGSIQVTFNPE